VAQVNVTNWVPDIPAKRKSRSKALTKDLYPDREVFRPERWMESKYPTFRAPLTEFPNLKRFSAFGFGRRICPGLESAENAMFITGRLVGLAMQYYQKKGRQGQRHPRALVGLLRWRELGAKYL
jgi:cytochrome P450